MDDALIKRVMHKARHTIIIKSINDIKVVDYDDSEKKQQQAVQGEKDPL